MRWRRPITSWQSHHVTSSWPIKMKWWRQELLNSDARSDLKSGYEAELVAAYWMLETTGRLLKKPNIFSVFAVQWLNLHPERSIICLNSRSESRRTKESPRLVYSSARLPTFAAPPSHQTPENQAEKQAERRSSRGGLAPHLLPGPTVRLVQ